LSVATPAPNPEEVMRLAHAIYWQDTKPILDKQDERFEQLLNYLIESEMTQAVHRSRPLRFDHRTIITLSTYAPEYLDCTTEVVGLPMLEEDGSDKGEKRDSAIEQRIMKAIQEVEQAGLSITVRNVQPRAKVRKGDVERIVRTYKASSKK